MSGAKQIKEDDIPVIDIGALGENENFLQVGQQLIWAASELGFIYVENHGISTATIASARAAGLAFFRLDAKQKRQAEINEFHHGYMTPGSSQMSAAVRADLKEIYNWGLERDATSDAPETNNRLLGPNRWPSAMPNLKPSVYPFFEQASITAQRVLQAFAVALALDIDFFLQHADRPVSRGSLQYYPPQAHDCDEERFGVAPHTDFGVLTVLCQDGNGGLELQLPNAEWRAVAPIEGTLVINVGDLLHRWSNGRLRSTPHRVINTSGRERLSLVLAYDPNFETHIESRSLCAPGQSPRWPDTTLGDYLLWRFEKAFAYRRT